MSKNIKKYYWQLHKCLFGRNFFPEGYLFLYPDVAAAGIDPWIHYIKYGMKEGRTAGWPDFQQFNPEKYLIVNDDVLKSGMNPWRHYVLYGFFEGRSNEVIKIDEKTHYNDYSLIPKDFNSELYIECNPYLKKLSIDPEIDYINNGIREKK